MLQEELKPNYFALAQQEDQALHDEVMHMGMDLGEEVFITQSQALRDRPDSSDTLADVSCPTLVLCGEEEKLCSVEMHEHMAQSIPQASLKVIDHCGHLSSIERPQAVNGAIETWLQESSLNKGVSSGAR